MTSFFTRRKSREPSVWLDPGPRGAPAELVHRLREAVQLVVVPRTGSRHAEVAVLLDPNPEQLARIRRTLPHTTLLALPSSAPSAALLITARRTTPGCSRSVSPRHNWSARSG